MLDKTSRSWRINIWAGWWFRSAPPHLVDKIGQNGRLVKYKYIDAHIVQW